MYYAPLTTRARARLATCRAARTAADARAYGASTARICALWLHTWRLVWRQTRDIRQ